MNAIHGLMKYFFWLPLLMLGGCQATLPEIKPFADKTAEMATAMNKGYAETEILLTQAVNSPEAKELQDNAKTLQDYTEELQKKWEPTKDALSAVVAYSDSLAAIADAGDKGSDSAKAVATSLNGLITAINPLVGVAQLPEQAVKTMQALYDYVAKVKARESLAQAVAEAQPAINQIANIMAKNFDSLAQIHKSAGIVQELSLFKRNQELSDYHRSLTRQLKIVIPTLTNILDYQNQASIEALQEAMKLDAPLKKAIERACPKEQIASCKDAPGIVETRQSQLLAKWRALQDDLKRIAPEYNAYLAQETALTAQISGGRLLINNSRKAIHIWRDTHEQIKGALEQKQRITIQQLATVIKDMVDIYNKGGK